MSVVHAYLVDLVAGDIIAELRDELVAAYTERDAAVAEMEAAKAAGVVAGDMVARAVPVRLAHQLEQAELVRDQWHAAYHVVEGRCLDLARALMEVRR